MPRTREKGTSLLLASASLVFIIPLIGLFLDVGIIYAVKSRLQASVDGAALAAARALNLGATTASQTSTAQQNAVNWFYANFPAGNWGTTNTQMSTANVNVFDDPNNAHVRNVTVSATTSVPTWFMKFFNIASTTLTTSGNASRRDVVAMIVLDRSGSMCSVNGAAATPPCNSTNANMPCAAMITAAKTFTGQFAAGRDRIGMISFSDGSFLHSSPSTSFQTTLGYSNTSGSGAGAIDTIDCNGGTGTAEAVSLAYNELYKQNLPGALNFIMLETDGLPNTLAYNWWDGAAAGISAGSSCQDATGKTKAGGGWTTLASMRQWTPGYNMNNGGTGFMANIPAGAIGSFYTADPAQGTFFINLFNPWQTAASGSNNSIAVTGAAPGCQFSSGTTTTYSDYAWLPGSDVYGNSVNPANAYKTITMNSGHIPLTGTIATDWTNAHGGALNATDNAAYRVRTNATLPAYMFVIGLGGNSGNPPDPILLQRMANDPNPDRFNSPVAYQPCASETGCVTYANQPQGTFIYSPNSTQLGQAFLSISSQILRLSR